MQYKHIVFDVDGTLVDTEYSVLHSFSEVLEALTGNYYPPEELTFALGVPSDDALKRYGLRYTPEVETIWAAAAEKYRNTIGLFPGIPRLLEALKAQGRCLGIVTSRTRDEFMGEIDALGITSLFDHLICADDTTEHKPQAAPLLKYLERSGATAAETLYVGDSIYDALCAQAAGVDFADAVWGSHTIDRPAQYFPGTPQELLEMLK